MRPKPSLHVSIAEQTVELRSAAGAVLHRFPVSTSVRGTGFENGSLRTPTGRFRVCAKVGRNAPTGMIFKARRATRRIARQGGEEDLVTSRILWLEGLEAENANTRERFIYFHGTNHEAQLGTPASHGCVRLANADIIKLFAQVPRGTPVFIA